MEDDMSLLKSLTFTTLPQPGANPTLDRRNRTIARLEEQKQLLADSSFMRIVRVTTKQDGQRVTAEKQQRVSPWWRVAPNGSYAFFIRVGVKPIEFEKGKTAVVVPTLDKLPSFIDALIAAVRGGKLDEQLAQGIGRKAPRRTSK
jgi:hypothetical protein